jgi:spore maturation protein A
MLNILWFGMILTSVVVGIHQGRLDDVVTAVTASAKTGCEIALGLAGVMSLWLGLMAIATESGLVRLFSRLLKPILRRLFPDVPVDHPAMGAMGLNIAANMLGLSNAATPFGIKAMEELQQLNHQAKVASNAMCTLLAINTSSVQLIPATAIAFLAANGCTNPSRVIFTSLIATFISTLVALVSVKLLEKLPRYRYRDDLMNISSS